MIAGEQLSSDVDRIAGFSDSRHHSALPIWLALGNSADSLAAGWLVDHVRNNLNSSEMAFALVPPGGAAHFLLATTGDAVRVHVGTLRLRL